MIFVRDAIGSLVSIFLAYSTVLVVVSYESALTAVNSSEVFDFGVSRVGCQNSDADAFFGNSALMNFGRGETTDVNEFRELPPACEISMSIALMTKRKRKNQTKKLPKSFMRISVYTFSSLFCRRVVLYNYHMPETTNFLKHQNSNPIQKFLINNFYNELFKLIKPLKPVAVLDVGCGEGFTLKKLQEKKIGKRNEGIDYSSDAIKIGKQIYPELELSKGNVYELQHKDNSFDMVLCTEVLEHLDDPAKAVGEIKRVASKYIVFSVPNEPFFILANFLRGKYLKSFGNHPEHINHWTAISFRRFLEKQGLTVVKAKYPFAWSLVLVRK